MKDTQIEFNGQLPPGQLEYISNVGAVKADQSKPPINLIARSAIEAEAAVMGFGATKYAANNWRKGMDWTRLTAAAMRHILAFNEGEDIDPESGLSHLAHARCCLAFLIEYQTKELGNDDRYKTSDPK